MESAARKEGSRPGQTTCPDILRACQGRPVNLHAPVEIGTEAMLSR